MTKKLVNCLVLVLMVSAMMFILAGCGKETVTDMEYNGGKYTGEVGKANITFKGITYTKVPNGNGVLQYPDGMHMDGTWEYGQFVSPHRSEFGAKLESAEKSKDQAENAQVELYYPLGESPKVFTTGWLFGAQCIVDGKNLSDQIQWSGTGKFTPATGEQSRPVFKTTGKNTIILRCKVGNKVIENKYTVQAVSSEFYAHVGSYAVCPADIHGCPACPHYVMGPITAGSPDVMINGQPAARKGDPGTHSQCCGANTFVIAEGDPQVLINGQPAARIGDATQHCGGIGHIVGAKLDDKASISWDEAAWQKIIAEFKAPATSEAKRLALQNKLKAEKLRLKAFRDNYLLCIPANWKDIDPNSEEGKQLAATREKINEWNRELKIIEDAL